MKITAHREDGYAPSLNGQVDGFDLFTDDVLTFYPCAIDDSESPRRGVLGRQGSLCFFRCDEFHHQDLFDPVTCFRRLQLCFGFRQHNRSDFVHGLVIDALSNQGLQFRWIRAIIHTCLAFLIRCLDLEACCPTLKYLIDQRVEMIQNVALGLSDCDLDHPRNCASRPGVNSNSSTWLDTTLEPILTQALGFKFMFAW